MLLERETSLLLIVDWQEALTAALPQAGPVRERLAMLLAGARQLGVPVLATEHCADRIGPTEPALRDGLVSAEIIAKTRFCLARQPGALARVRAIGRAHLVICGAEAHVCVLQSALGLAQAGFSASIVADCVASRRESDRNTALARAAHHGIEPVSAEMVLFEWLGDADTTAFRKLLPHIKAVPGRSM